MPLFARLQTLPERALYALPQLEELSLAENRFKALAASALPTLHLRLRYLNVSSNYLAAFRPPALPALRVLDLSANELAFGVQNRDDDDENSGGGGSSGDRGGSEFSRALPSLQRLHVAHSTAAARIIRAASSLPQLLHLDARHAALRALPTTLAAFRHLRSLNVDDNQIAALNGARLPPCLTTLHARNNFVHRVGNLSYAQLSCLKELDLSANPLDCEASLATIAPLLKQQSSIEVSKAKRDRIPAWNRYPLFCA